MDQPMTDASGVLPPVDLNQKKRKREETREETSSGAAEAAAVKQAKTETAEAASTVPLIGAVGGDTIRHALAHTPNPAAYIRQFQAEHGMKSPGLESSLCFLDLFAPRRSSIYASMLGELNERLTDRISRGQVDREKMLALLEASFPYLRVEELRGVPLALLQSLAGSKDLPSKYQKALLASPQKVLDSLPLQLRRWLMEAEPERLFWLQPQWIEWLNMYANDPLREEEYATLLPLDSLAARLKRVRNKPAHGSTAVSVNAAAMAGSSTAANAASQSAVALHGMLEWIGSSSRLYDYASAQIRQLVLAAERSNQPGDAQVWRSLRVDLLMRLHDSQHDPKQQQQPPHSTSPQKHHHLASHLDHLHTWVWCLDAAVKDNATLGGKLVDKLLGTPDANGALTGGFLAGLKAKYAQAPSTLPDLALFAGHPFIRATLLNSILAALAEAVEKEVTPKEHAPLKPLTLLANMAFMRCEALLPAEGAPPPSLPLTLPAPADEEVLYSEFYPFIAELLIYAQLGEMEPLKPKSVEIISSSALSRAVFLFYVLSRLAQQDVQQTTALLPVLASLTTSGGSNMWASEAASGAQGFLQSVLHTAVSLLLAGMKPAIRSDAALRSAVFERAFVPLAKISPAAHKEALRLLTACGDAVPAEEAAQFLKQMQKEGARGQPSSPSPPPPRASSPALQAQPAASESKQFQGTPKVNSTLHAQISSLYQQLQIAQPALIKK